MIILNLQKRETVDIMTYNMIYAILRSECRTNLLHSAVCSRLQMDIIPLYQCPVKYSGNTNTILYNFLTGVPFIGGSIA